MHSSQDTSTVNQNPPIPSNFFSLAMDSGGGFLPPRGSGAAVSVVWGKLFGCDESTVRRWVRDLKIPHRKLGKALLIDCDAFWDFLPLISQLEDDPQE